MKQLSRMKYLAMALLFLPMSHMSAQSGMEELANAYNQGIQMADNNPEAAIKAFKKVISMADAVGTDEALSLKETSMSQVPKLYYNWARKLGGSGDLQGAITQLNNCIEASEKYNNEQYPVFAKNTLTKIYVSIANNSLGSKDYEEALKNYKMAEQYDSLNVSIHRGKVLLYDAQGMHDEMVKAAQDGIKAAEVRPAETPKVNDIKRVVRNSFFNAAQVSMQNEEYVKVEENLLNSIEYGNETDIVYYQLGLARNAMNRWKDAIEAFGSALELSKGDAADKAKIYYNMAKAYESTGDNTKACDAYKNALYGEFAEAAKYQMETVLKCGDGN